MGRKRSEFALSWRRGQKDETGKRNAFGCKQRWEWRIAL